MSDYQLVPMVLRGRVVTNDLVEFAARGDDVMFASPDPQSYLDELILRDPTAMRDVHELSTDDVLDYLEELGGHLDPHRNEHMRVARQLSYASAPTTAPLVDEQYRIMPAVFARATLEDMLDTSIDRAYLDRWVPSTLRDGRTIEVRAFGCRCVHITAGNSPMMAALAVIRNALTRGDAIIKSPSNDPLTAAAIAQTMCEVAPGHPLTRHLSVAYWPGGDERIESIVYQPQCIEKIVAWGGFASIKHVTRYIQPGVELVSFDPKRSASVVGEGAFADEDALDEAASRLAVDIGALNQAACANARTVFVICGTNEQGRARLDDLAERVYRAMLALPKSVSTSPKHGIARDLLAEIDAARLQEDWFHVIGGEHGEGAILVSRLPEPVDFAAALGDRVANLVPIDNLAEVPAFFDAYTQTVGVFPESLKEELRDLAGLRGAQRIVSLGYSCSSTLAGPQDAIEPLRRLCRWVVDERSSPSTLPLGELMATAGA